MEDLLDYAPAKKSLGQHFLTNAGIVHTIVETGMVSPRDCVVEIGPGRGILTRALVPVAREVIALEKDELLCVRLQYEFKKEIAAKKLTLISQDVLLFQPEQYLLQPGGYKVIANIPYYITGAIIKKFLSEAIYPNTIVLMVQREVAKRIVARDGKESILSIAVKAYGTPTYVATVKAGSFNPPPKVDSAILKIESISKNHFKEISEHTFFTILKAGFAQKRKKLSSNLSLLLPKEAVIDAFALSGIDESARAETLTVENWKSLTKQLATAFTKPTL